MSCASRTPGGIFTRRVCSGRLPGAGIGTLQTDRARRTLQDFVKRHQDVALDVLATLGEWRAARGILLRSAETAEWATATAEELLEEIAETGAIEMEFRTLFGAAAESTLRLRCLPFRMVPIRSQLIVLSPLLRVAENFVGLVDFLELFFGNGLVFGNVGVIVVGEFAECLLDFFVARITGHAENVVVVLEFNGHGWLRGNGSDHSQ